ncbi:MAG: type II secretion system protein [Deltaproteobacteria bacterium]|nr:type II secretion system protein [Deltaproteobacteria bacterium]
MKNGFTLLEVMIAIGILAITLVAISGLQGNSLRRSGRSEKLSVAVQLARQVMNQKIIEFEDQIERGEFPEAKEDQGEFEKFPDFRWEVKLKKMEAPPMPTQKEGGNAGAEQFLSFISDKLGESMRVLKVTIFWKELEEEENFGVTTHLANIKTGASSFQVQTGDGAAPTTQPSSAGGAK